MDRDVEVVSSLSSLVDLSTKTGGGLYVARTLRHKRLLAIMRHFCGRVSLCENLDAKELWPKLSEWIITNPEKASKCATIWLSEWIIMCKPCYETYEGPYRGSTVCLEEVERPDLNRVESKDRYIQIRMERTLSR